MLLEQFILSSYAIYVRLVDLCHDMGLMILTNYISSYLSIRKVGVRGKQYVLFSNGLDIPAWQIDYHRDMDRNRRVHRLDSTERLTKVVQPFLGGSQYETLSTRGCRAAFGSVRIDSGMPR